MDYTILLIGIAIVIALIAIGKIFSFLTKILFVIIIIALLSAALFFWHNQQNPVSAKTSLINITTNL